MAGYRYEALSKSGQLEKGVIESDSARLARTQLREQGLSPVSVTALKTSSMMNITLLPGMQWQRALSANELAMLTRQFATLIGAGLTIEQTLNALIAQTESETTKRTLAVIRGEVLGGQTLSRALATQHKHFPELYRALVAAGESSGQLGQVLAKLADYTESQQSLRNKVLLALIYPVIVTLVAMMVVGSLLTWVVPQVVQVFQHTHQALPILTRSMIALSDFVRNSGGFVLLIIIASLFLFSRALRNENHLYRWHVVLLKLPVVGKMIRAINTAQLTSTLAILVNARVPLLVALNSGIGVLSNIPMRRALIQAERHVREGASLSRAFNHSKLFPPMMIHLISGGEASGKLDEMLEKIAVIQTQEVENRVMVFTRLLEPALILFMGGMVLLIVLAILLPIFDLNQIIR
jgi:general secretion pathway protein F